VAVFLEGSRTVEAEAVRRDLERIGAHDIVVDRVPAADWLADYRSLARPFRVGSRWFIDPLPEDPSSPDAGRIRLVVEPSTAFGSGSHESTQLMLQALETRNLEDSSVLDVGTGSGILAFAAQRLGASPVVALDVDIEAVWAARRASGHQDVAVRVQFVAGDSSALGDVMFDVVLCNIVSSELLRLLPELRRLLKSAGAGLLAGLLVSERELLEEPLRSNGLRVVQEFTSGEWMSLEVARA
jgi:ribosomal protein L11 methyltransferase